MEFVTDTHALFWYLTASSLPERIKRLFQLAEEGRGIVVVPSIVLAEFFGILKKERKTENFPRFLQTVESETAYLIYPLDIKVLKQLPSMPTVLDIHDQLIVATARLLRLPLLTKDTKIQKSYPKTFW